MASFSLTHLQMRFLQTFGYLRLPALLRDSIGEIETAFERILSEQGADAYAGQHRFTLLAGMNWSEGLCRAFLDSAQIDAVLASVLGEDYQYCTSELSLCGGDTPWHSDSAWQKTRRTPGWYKILVYLDPLTAETGALRVIPGSHRCDDGFASDVHRGIIDERKNMLADPLEFWGIPGRAVPGEALPSEPGDVILLNHMTVHASFGGFPRRRLMGAVFFPRLTGGDLHQLHDVIRTGGYTRSRLFGKGAAILHSASPRRLSHLEQLLEHTPDDSATLRRLFAVSTTAAGAT